MSAQEMALALGGASRGTNGWWQAKCPAHDDGKASLGLHDAEDGGVAWRCLAGCDARLVGAALRSKGLLKGKVNGAERKGKDKTKAELGIVEKIYDYVDAKRELVLQVLRYRPKDFRQRRPDPNKPGEWIWKVAGMRDRPLYRLPELLAADPAEPVLVVEGEKDVDRLLVLGLVATTTAQGADGWPLSDHGPLAGRHVVLVPDNDDSGCLYSAMVGRDLSGRAASVRLLQLPGLPPKGDVSDWLDAGGTVEELRRLAAAAPAYEAQYNVEEPEEWPEPEPLSDEDEPQLLPLDALPSSVAQAVSEYQAYGQQPVEMVVGSALSAISGCSQALVDVRREEKLVGPVSLNIAIIADSGERKTACDRAFWAAAQEWATAEAARIHPLREEAVRLRAAHESQIQGVLNELRSVTAKSTKLKGDARAKADADIDALKVQIKKFARTLPPLPPYPTPRLMDISIEGATKHLRSAWPSLVIGTAEGGIVLGGHGFSDDARTRTLASLNALWDGDEIDRARSLEDYSRVGGRRLSVSLMMQTGVFRDFIKGGNGAARDLGALARMLVAWPRSAIGTRLRDADAPEPALPALGRFLARAAALYASPLPMPFNMETMEAESDADGDPVADPLKLAPTVLALSAQSRRLWLDYHNECEGQSAPEGELFDVRDVAAKSPENACRLAALFHTWTNGPHGEIGVQDMQRGIVIARWFLREARRVLCASGDHVAAPDALRLAQWVKSRPAPPTLKEAAQLAPYRLRKKAAREAAIALLTERHWLRQEKRNGGTVLVLKRQISSPRGRSGLPM